MNIQPYLFFEGKCEEAVQFYASAVGAEPGTMMRFSESPDKQACAMLPPGHEDKIMHGEMRIGDSIVLVSDGMCQRDAVFDGFMLSIDANDVAHAETLFSNLLDGGEVTMPLGETFFAERFGMVKDRFGMHWSVGAAWKEGGA